MAQRGVDVNAKLMAVLARQEAVRTDPQAHGPQLSVSAICRQLGISRQTYYVAARRFAADGVPGLIPRSRRPHASPGQTTPAVEDLVVQVRKQLAEEGWDNGAESIAFRLGRAGHPVPSRATINRILSRRGLVTPQPAKRPRSSWKRFAFTDRNDCWQVDAFCWKLADGHPATVFQLLDDATRYEVASLAAPGETGEAARACFLAGVAEYGTPAMLLSDNGTAFTAARHGRQSLLEATAADLGCKTVQSSPYHPQTCGKNERSHATCQQWLRAQPAPATLTDLQTLLDQYRPLYNQRPHQALGGRTPAEAAATAAVAVPAAAPTHPPAAPRISQHKVSASGCINFGSWSIPIGRARKSQTLTVIRDGDHITIYDGNTLLRDFQLDHSRTYQTAAPATDTLSAMS